MARWLFKEEPEHYNYGRLEADGEAIWDGVKNPMALKYLRQVRPGDRVLYYHTGKEKAVVAEMEIVGEPEEKDGNVRVRVKPIRRLTRAVPLSRIKEVEALATWELVRLPRLSVMPVSEEQWQRIEELANEPAPEPQARVARKAAQKSGREPAQ